MASFHKLSLTEAEAFQISTLHMHFHIHYCTRFHKYCTKGAILLTKIGLVVKANMMKDESNLNYGALSICQIRVCVNINEYQIRATCFVSPNIFF